MNREIRRMEFEKKMAMSKIPTGLKGDVCKPWKRKFFEVKKIVPTEGGTAFWAPTKTPAFEITKGK